MLERALARMWRSVSFFWAIYTAIILIFNDTSEYIYSLAEKCQFLT